jgi:hypothetical protein
MEYNLDIFLAYRLLPCSLDLQIVKTSVTLSKIYAREFLLILYISQRISLVEIVRPFERRD